MSNVEFEEDQMSYGTRGRTSVSGAGSFGTGNAGPKMAQWLIRHGFAKSPNSAQLILIGVVVLNVIITIILIKFFL